MNGTNNHFQQIPYTNHVYETREEIRRPGGVSVSLFENCDGKQWQGKVYYLCIILVIPLAISDVFLCAQVDNAVVAERLGISKGAASKRFSRMMKALHEHIAASSGPLVTTPTTKSGQGSDSTTAATLPMISEETALERGSPPTVAKGKKRKLVDVGQTVRLSFL